MYYLAKHTPDVYDLYKRTTQDSNLAVRTIVPPLGTSLFIVGAAIATPCAAVVNKFFNQK